MECNAGRQPPPLLTQPFRKRSDIGFQLPNGNFEGIECRLPLFGSGFLGSYSRRFAQSGIAKFFEGPVVERQDGIPMRASR